MINDAAMVQEVARVAIQPRDGGSGPTSPLQNCSVFKPKDLVVRPIPHGTAKAICVERHYLGSYPGGALLNFGVFAGHALVGVAVFGVGPYNIHRYLEGAHRGQVITLARLWLDDRCGRNSESRVLGVICRLLGRCQDTVKAIVAYSDPMVGHDGAIYRAAGFLYLGLSEAMPLYRLADGTTHHSRSLSHTYGTHSLKYLRASGVAVEPVARLPKYSYMKFLDPDWRQRLKPQVLSYPKLEGTYADS